jgi:hypothetical protein
MLVLLVCVMATTAAACSKKRTPSTDETGPQGRYAPLQPAIKSDKSTDRPQTGSITGRVVFTGNKPQTTTTPASRCSKHAPNSDTVVVNPNGTLRDVLVRIAPGSETGVAAPATPVALEQKDCTYSPRVTGALIGAALTVHNADPTTHDVQIVRGEQTLVDVKLKAGAADLSETDLTSEVGLLKIASKSRPGMAAFVAVSDNPYFQTTGTDGTFRLDGLAPGKHAIEAWHPMFGTRSASLQVEAGKAIDIAFGFDGTVTK